jgi:hypothetical protein
MTAPLRVGDDIEGQHEIPFFGMPGERPLRRSSGTKECAHWGVVPGHDTWDKATAVVDRDIQASRCTPCA